MSRRAEKPPRAWGVMALARVLRLADRLSARNLRVGTAESCTGGHVVAALTDVPACSHYVAGSVVAYCDELKQSVLGVQRSSIDQWTAVSECVAREMLTGALDVLGCDCAIATTGYAGPAQDPHDTDVGEVWVAVGTREMVKTQRFQFGDDRTNNAEAVVCMAIDMLADMLDGL